jgi:methyltransferase family protein
VFPGADWYPFVIAATCRFYPRCTYIEIGVARGGTLRIVAPVCAEVHAVDMNAKSESWLPPGVRFWHMRSDDFFGAFEGSVPNVIFIDANHAYEQAKRDFIGALGLLGQGGTIFLHDTWPVSEDHTRPPTLCGTVWKLAEELRESAELESFTWAGFPGLTIVRRRGEGRERSQLRG